MNANDLTFGVEIETTVPMDYPVGEYHGATPARGLPEGWTAQRDGSIRATRPDTKGCEFVSPVLRGVEGVRQLLAAVNAIRQLGANVNRSTGLHIHVGFDRSDAAALARLVTLTANFEKAIYASTGTKSRERGCFCAPVSAFGSAEAARAHADRYRVLNIVSTRPTVEFRAFAGTLNAEKIVSYLRMCLGLVERALKAKRVTNWTAKAPVATSPIARKGDGQTALVRLFYQLGWNKGRTNYAYGHLDADFLPTIQVSKRVLMGLARKYDGRTDREI